MKVRPAIVIAGIAALVLGAYAVLHPYSDPVRYQGHRLPLKHLRVVDPHPGCEYTHYHATDGDSVLATNGAVVDDEGDCGYGPVQ